MAGITRLSSCVKTFVSWTEILYRSAKNSATSITIFSKVVEIFVRWTTIFSQLCKKLCSDSKFCLKVTKNLWLALKYFLSVTKTESWATFRFTMSKVFLKWFTIVSDNSEKIVARNISFSHDVNNFVTCLKVLFRSVNISERGIKTLLVVSKNLRVDPKIWFTVPETLRRESPFCQTVSENLWCAPPFCLCFFKLCVHSHIFVWKWQTFCELL